MGGQFGDVNQPFQSGLELDKCAEVGHAGDFSRDNGVLRKTIGGAGPGIAAGLFDAESHPMRHGIEGDRGTKFASGLPLQRLGEASDICDAAVWLAANATWMTGQTIVLDGGGLVRFLEDDTDE